MLWNLTNSEIRVVSTSGSCEKQEDICTISTSSNMDVMFGVFSLLNTYSKFLDESDEFAPKWVRE